MSQFNVKGKKTFWQRPEGWPGAIVLAAIIGFGGYALFKFLPNLIELAENIYYLAAMIGGGFIITYMLLDKRVRTMLWYLYKKVIRWGTGVFIQLDPIGIIESFLDDLRKKMDVMRQQVGKLKGQIRILQEKIKARMAAHDKYMSLAATAKRQGDEARAKLNSRKAIREKKVAQNFGVLKEKTETLYRVLEKMRKYSDIMVDDIAHEIEMKKEEREVIRTSHGVMKSAVNIINGNSDRKVIFDQAMEYIVDDIGERIGEMEYFMDMSSDFMNNMDLENAMYEEEGMAALDEWSRKVEEKFDATKYESPTKALEKGSVEFQDREKVKVTRTQNTNTNTSSNQKSKYF
jgi:phage shock protein A